MIVTCDSCKKDFLMEPKEDEVMEGISKVYFTCSHCEEEYISHYTSVLVKSKQHQIRKIQEEFNQAKNTGNIDKANRLFNKHQKLKKSIAKDMNNLEKRCKDLV